MVHVAVAQDRLRTGLAQLHLLILIKAVLTGNRTKDFLVYTLVAPGRLLITDLAVNPIYIIAVCADKFFILKDTNNLEFITDNTISHSSLGTL